MLKYFPLGFRIAGLYQGKWNQKVKKALALIQILWSWYRNTSSVAFAVSMLTCHEPSTSCSHSGSWFSWNGCILHSSFRWSQWWHKLEDAAERDSQSHHPCPPKWRKGTKQCELVANILFPGPDSLWWQSGISTEVFRVRLLCNEAEQEQRQRNNFYSTRL